MVTRTKIRKRRNIINKTCLFLLFIVTISCQDSKRNIEEYSFQNIDEDVTSLINNKNIEVLNISKLTPFKWDKLYVFKPFTPIENINNSLGFVWENAKETLIN